MSVFPIDTPGTFEINKSNAYKFSTTVTVHFAGQAIIPGIKKPDPSLDRAFGLGA